MLVLDDPPDTVVRPVGRAFHEDDRRAAGHRADDGPRPHDPAHVRREEHAISGAEVGLVRRLAHDRQQEAALHVQRPLRLSGRSRRVGEEVRGFALDDRRARACPADPRRRPPTTSRAPRSSGTRRPRDARRGRCSTLGASASASSSTSFIGTSLPRRYDASAVSTSRRAGVGEPRGDSGPGEAREDRHLHRSDVRARVRRDRGLGCHRQERAHDVALADPELAQRLREPAHLARELCPRQRASLAVLGDPHRRFPLGQSRAPSDGRTPRRRSAARPRTRSSTRCRASRRAPRPSGARAGSRGRRRRRARTGRDRRSRARCSSS